MSFSSSIKEDLVKQKIKAPSQRLSLLSGMILCCGSLYIGRGTGVSCSTETLSVGKLVTSLATGMYDLDATIELSERERSKNALTVVTLTGAGAERLLLDTGLLVPSDDGGVTLNDGLAERLVADPEDARMFLRGAFLGSGSCANPARSYHLELVLRSEQIAGDLSRLINGMGVCAHHHRRKDRFIVYLKGEDVSGFLALIGASSAALAFENVRAEKDFRNYVNRTSNCETANIGKTVDAALAQVHAIEVIERTMDLNRLPVPLYEAAMLRLNHPEATLQELADLAEIGKSGMNHRLARLLKLAEEIENG